MNPRSLLAGATALLALSAVVVAVLVVSGVIGGDGDDDAPSADEIARRVEEAISSPGMVYHTAAEGNEIWIDAENQLFRREESTADGVLISVGEGWGITTYDPFRNEITDEDLNPQGPDRPRIDHPMSRWTDALSALGFGRELTTIGRAMADDREVLVVEARSPLVGEDGGITGQLIGRVEIDAETYLPHSFQRRQTAVDGTTPTPVVGGVDPNRRIVYTTAELIPSETLAADFFARSVVEAQVLSLEENLQQARELGLTPLWLQQTYQTATGILSLPPQDAVLVNPADETAEVHYALIVPVSATDFEPLSDSVIVRLAIDPAALAAPEVEGFGGDLPEQQDEVSVRGQTAVLYTSLLTVSDLPCTESICPEATAALYRRLIFSVGDTWVQIEASSRIDAGGSDRNGFNSRDGLIELAQVLIEVT